MACVGTACVVLPHPQNGGRPYLLRHPVLAFLNALLLAATLGSALLVSLTPEVARLSTITAAVLHRLANAERREAGLPLLTENPLLTRAAQLKGEHMLRHDYFEHVSPDGLSPWVWFDRVGYDYRYAGENLAIDFTEAEDVVTAWLKSTGHRRNLLSDRYNETGLAVVTGEFEGRRATVVVHLFGNRASGAASPLPAPPPAVRETATAALPPPGIQEPADGATVTARTVTVRGTAPAGSTVRIALDSTTVGTFAAAGGTFEGTIPIPGGEERLAQLTAVATRGEQESPPSLSLRIQLDTKAPEISLERVLLLPDPDGIPGSTLLVASVPPDVVRATVSLSPGEPIPLRREGPLLSALLPLGQGPLTLRATDAHGNTETATVHPFVSYATAEADRVAPRREAVAAASRVRPWLTGILTALASLLVLNVFVHVRFHRILHPDLFAHAFGVLVLGTLLSAFT